jgi:NADH dehydrogenase
MSDDRARPRVVVVGGGFGGLLAVQALRRGGVDITLIDRHNYHLFQPLSYQVATGTLSPGEIAAPLRKIFRRRRDVTVLMGEVAAFDLDRRELRMVPLAAGLAPRTIGYDFLLVAGGSSYAYFGHDEWRTLALEVKSLDSALEVRGRILQAFEAAELETDGERRAAWLTFVVVGAGPTGVEMAGQIG